MRKLVLVLLLAGHISSVHAIMFNNEGIDTGKAFLKWESLISLDSKVKTLQTLCLLSTALSVGTFVYFKWFNQPQEQKSTQDNSDLAVQ